MNVEVGYMTWAFSFKGGGPIATVDTQTTVLNDNNIL